MVQKFKEATQLKNKEVVDEGSQTFHSRQRGPRWTRASGLES